MKISNLIEDTERVRIRILPDGRMSRRDAARYLGLAEKTLAIWACEGRGPKGYKVGGRVFYFLDDLEAYVGRDHTTAGM